MDLAQSGTNGTKARGNTKTRAYFITTFQENEFGTLEQLISESQKHAYCEEHCPTTGKIHRHLWIYFKHARSWNSMKESLPTSRIEKAKGDDKEGLIYCSKEKLISTNIRIPKPLKIIENLYPWQKDIENIVINEPESDRVIHWYWEPNGGVGKTQLIKYLLTKYDFCEFSRATKSADIVTVVDIDKTCYLFDFARSQEGFAPYLALEQLKDGLVSDSKLKKKSRNIVMNSPHVICFANWPPDMESLSADKWHIVRL